MLRYHRYQHLPQTVRIKKDIQQLSNLKLRHLLDFFVALNNNCCCWSNVKLDYNELQLFAPQHNLQYHTTKVCLNVTHASLHSNRQFQLFNQALKSTAFSCSSSGACQSIFKEAGDIMQKSLVFYISHLQYVHFICRICNSPLTFVSFWMP